MHKTFMFNALRLESLANRQLEDENAKLRATNLIQAAQIYDLNLRIAELMRPKYTPIIRKLDRRPI